RRAFGPLLRPRVTWFRRSRGQYPHPNATRNACRKPWRARNPDGTLALVLRVDVHGSAAMRTGLAIAIVAIAPITGAGIYAGNSSRAQDGWRSAQTRQVAQTPESPSPPSEQSAPENPPSTATPPAAAPPNPSPGTPAMVLDDQE